MHCTAENGTVSTECYAPTARPPFLFFSLLVLPVHAMLLFWLQVADKCCNAAFLPTELMLAQSLTTLAANLNGRLQSLIYTSSHPRSNK
ncbi:hypothetical protein J3F84DRAFT_365227 [Trichoderma pleuroticola]